MAKEIEKKIFTENSFNRNSLGNGDDIESNSDMKTLF